MSPGCPKCARPEATVRQAVAVDGVVRVTGRAPDKAEELDWLK